MKKENNLVWIDLEMTGLNPERHVIVEIAVVITDAQLEIIAEGPSLVIHQPEDLLDRMDEWVLTQHTKTGLLAQVRSSTLTIERAEQHILDFLQKYCITGMAPLCGNSIWKDREFLQRYMPNIIDFLNYRMIDVSSFKEIILRWYAQSPYAEFIKKDTHRALEDIKESIAELNYYREHFFVREHARRLMD